MKVQIIFTQGEEKVQIIFTQREEKGEKENENGGTGEERGKGRTFELWISEKFKRGKGN